MRHPRGGLFLSSYTCPFGVTLSLCLGSFAYSGHVFRLPLDFVLSSFLGTHVDSKGLIEFVPLELTSFLNFLRVSRRFAAGFWEHSVAGIVLALTSRGSSLTYITPASVSSHGRRGPPPRKIEVASPPTSICVGYHRAAHLSRPPRPGPGSRQSPQRLRSRSGSAVCQPTDGRAASVPST